MDVKFMHLSPLRGGGGRPAFIYPVAYLVESGVETHWQGVLAADLHAVVPRRVVARGNLHGGAETVVDGAEIYHRSAAQAYVPDIGTGIAYPLYQGVMYLG